MRRGYKTWCENTTAEFRNSLGQQLNDALDVEALAAHLEVEILRPADLPDLSVASLHQLTVTDPESWSAVTLRIDGATLTILNSTHALTRQRSSLAHELAHLILDHRPGRIDISPAGHLLLSSFEKEQEDEADWLSGSLLVPRAGLQRMYRSAPDPQVLAEHFGVSLQLLQWRLRMTGVAIQARRATRRRT